MGRQKIMVVDDEESILESTRMLLDVLGYDSVTVKDPAQVIEIAAREAPDLILQDLKMPALDLPSLVRGLRSDPRTADIPFAFFSASHQISETAAQHDAQGFLTKPFSEHELVTLLDRTIGSHHPPRTREEWVG